MVSRRKRDVVYKCDNCGVVQGGSFRRLFTVWHPERMEICEECLLLLGEFENWVTRPLPRKEFPYYEKEWK